jgi:arylsulfatase A
MPATACPDSFNVLPALLGRAGAKGRQHLVEQGPNAVGLRAGDWKLVRLKKNKFELYNLAQDPGETTDVAQEHPERTREMIAQLARIKKGTRTRP